MLSGLPKPTTPNTFHRLSNQLLVSASAYRVRVGRCRRSREGAPAQLLPDTRVLWYRGARHDRIHVLSSCSMLLLEFAACHSASSLELEMVPSVVELAWSSARAAPAFCHL